MKKPQHDVSIIICDDEHIIAESIERLVRKTCNNYKVSVKTHISKNGIDCLYYIYNECIEGRKIDLLLIDENMPFMVGSQCIKILKNSMSDKWLNKFKIYSITGYVDKDNINYIKQSGSDGFYTKPICLNMIKDLLLKSEIIKDRMV